MSESESDALPLGDTPIFGSCLDDLHIISNGYWFVKSFLKKSQKNAFFSFFHILLCHKAPIIIQKAKIFAKKSRSDTLLHPTLRFNDL